MHQILSEPFIREFQNKVCWNYISDYQKLSEPFIREFQNKINWYSISTTQKLSEPFIREFQNKVGWYSISMTQSLSENFILEFKDRIDWVMLFEFNEFSEEFVDYCISNLKINDITLKDLLLNKFYFYNFQNNFSDKFLLKHFDLIKKLPYAFKITQNVMDQKISEFISTKDHFIKIIASNYSLDFYNKHKEILRSGEECEKFIIYSIDTFRDKKYKDIMDLLFPNWGWLTYSSNTMISTANIEVDKIIYVLKNIYGFDCYDDYFIGYTSSIINTKSKTPEYFIPDSTNPHMHNKPNYISDLKLKCKYTDVEIHSSSKYENNTIAMKYEII